MVKDAFLTIAIPTFNRLDRVTALVESILPQLEPDDELIVIDDGSSDGTSESLRSIERVKLLHNPTNLGMVKTWNACLLSAHRDWICLLHDDDLLAPNGLGNIRALCSRSN